MAPRPSGEALLLAATTASLAAGGVAWFAGARPVADGCWAAATALAIIPAAWWVIDALRRRVAGVDLMALLALIGTLVVGEYLAGTLIAVMLGTGRTLDRAAERRATRDLRALLQRAPRVARRRDGDEIREVPLDAVRPGDDVVVGPGDVVPVDGVVAGVTAVLDESALTGEPDLVERARGDEVRSGVVNAGAAFELCASATAADSTYAGIVDLVRNVGAQSAPVVRLADRYAGWFLWVSLAVSGVAWAVSGSLVRAVAVLVVATPCPLLLAAPVAIVSGLARASGRGVIVRGGAALESLAGARTMVIDKTGTLTAGRPAVLEVSARPGISPDDVLMLAASADLLSSHVLAASIVAEARRRGLQLGEPHDVAETPGRGVRATVDGHRVDVGRRTAAGADWTVAVVNRARLDGAGVAWVTVDGVLTGAVLLRDPVRSDAARTVRRLRSAGIQRLVMLTGDRPEPALEIGTVLGLDEVCPEQTPESKLAAVRREQGRATTVMVGDGINDAPALAAADVGVAMGGRGATASSEAADIVLTTDRLDRLADAMDIARRARRIAVQSALAGIGLSLVAMGIAALGWLPPAWGALLQEGIDVAVIANALRALRGSRAIAVAAKTEALLQRFADEHDELRSLLPLLRDAADAVTASGLDARAVASVLHAHDALVQRILPHERAEESELYPALSEPLGGEATGPMSRMHAEIERLTRRLGVHAAALRRGDAAAVPVDDLLACLYGLHAVLTLHFVQEEENYFTLISSDAR